MPIVSYEARGDAALVRMDDGKANALSDVMVEAIYAAVDRAEREAQALVLVGRPDRFCAGFDLRVMMQSPEAAKALLQRGCAMYMKLYGSAVPVVAACTGHALAGGALLLLASDVRIGAAGAYRIGLNEVAIGLPVPVLAMELARSRLVPTELPRATLFATIYDPEGAVRAGFLDVVTGADDVLAKAKQEAERLGALSRTAFVATKERLRGKTIEHIIATIDSDMASLLTPSA